jgi:hypothetical protein
MPSDFDRQNPYASPAEVSVSQQPQLSREEALAKLRFPALALRIAAALSVLWGVGACVVICYIEFVVQRRLKHPDEWADIIGGIMVSIVMAVLFGFVLYAAHRVVRGHTRAWLWIAIVGGLIPLAPCGITLPFAFWLLHLRLRKNLRAALAQSA